MTLSLLSVEFIILFCSIVLVSRSIESITCNWVYLTTFPFYYPSTFNDNKCGMERMMNLVLFAVSIYIFILYTFKIPFH